MSAGFNQNKMGSKKNWTGFGYRFSNDGNAFEREQVIESLNPEGKFTNISQNRGKSSGNNHNLSWNTVNNAGNFFLQAYANATYNNSQNNNSAVSNQYGILRQDLTNGNGSKNSSPNLNANFSFNKKLINKNNNFSGRTSFALSGTEGNQTINTNTLYYDRNTNLLLKDSVLNRELTSNSLRRNFDIGFNYSLGLKKPKDTLGRRSINFEYSASAGLSSNNVETFAFDNLLNKPAYVDSLSTSFKSLTLNQQIGVNYNHQSTKKRYNFGFNAAPNLISNRDLRLQRKTDLYTINFSPRINYSQTLSTGKTFSMNYQGYNRNPGIEQLQPIRNTQSLQNIVVGNPDLRPSFNHNLSTNFNYAHKKGTSLQAGLSASTTQREIVSNVTLIPDTLNSLKQITRYENINGNYNLNGNYFLMVPLSKNKSVRYSGSVGFSNRAIFFNNEKSYGKGVNFSQDLQGAYNAKKVTLNGGINYSVTGNNNISNLYNFSSAQTIGIGQIAAPAFFTTKTIRANLRGDLRLKKLSLNANSNFSKSHNSAKGDQAIPDVSNFNINFSGRVTLKQSYFININTTKIVNYGYSLANSNPLLIGFGLEKAFMKDKSLHLSVNGQDLLGQGNNISRTVSGNTIIDSRNKQQTRLFSVNLTYSLSKFGGKHFRVDPDH